MAFDLNDIELQATREMNKTAWESEIDKWSKEYLIERYKDLVEIEKEHKKEICRLQNIKRKDIQDLINNENENIYKNFISKDKLSKLLEKRIKQYRKMGFNEAYSALVDLDEELLEERR